MITVKEAAQRAIEYVIDLLGRDNVGQPRIEEVDLTDDNEYWLVTVGFFPPAMVGNIALQQFSPKREYKQVKVTTADGSIRSMKIRTV
jgi:hypothetical protein